MATVPQLSQVDEDLQPYLAMVDRELALHQSPVEQPPSIGQSPTNRDDSDTSDSDTGNVEPRREGDSNSNG